MAQRCTLSIWVWALTTKLAALKASPVSAWRGQWGNFLRLQAFWNYAWCDQSCHSILRQDYTQKNSHYLDFWNFFCYASKKCARPLKRNKTSANSEQTNANGKDIIAKAEQLEGGVDVVAAWKRSHSWWQRSQLSTGIALCKLCSIEHIFPIKHGQKEICQSETFPVELKSPRSAARSAGAALL